MSLVDARNTYTRLFLIHAISGCFGCACSYYASNTVDENVEAERKVDRSFIVTAITELLYVKLIYFYVSTESRKLDFLIRLTLKISSGNIFALDSMLMIVYTPLAVPLISKLQYASR